MNLMRHTEAARLVGLERRRQDAKWGEFHGRGLTDREQLAILVEEVGEIAKAILDEEPREALRAEWVQVAAVAMAVVESELSETQETA